MSGTGVLSARKVAAAGMPCRFFPCGFAGSCPAFLQGLSRMGPGPRAFAEWPPRGAYEACTFMSRMATHSTEKDFQRRHHVVLK
jgi:hypothetical protein